MQALHLFFDISAVAAALGAGAVLVRTNGRLRSAEAKRNALQARMKELEDERAAGVAKADDATAAVQATTEKLLQAANKRVADLEKAVLNAEKQQATGVQHVADLEKSLADQRSIAQQNSLALEQAKAAVALPTPTVLSAPTAEVLTEAPPVRVPSVSAKKALMTVLLGASREAKSPGEIEKHLTDANYKVVRATNSENILTTAHDTRPDLVVLDTQISGGDSLTALESFKGDSELRDIPIVIVCALKDRDRAIELGAAGCVVPPITSNVLLGTVKTAFIAHRKRMERSRLAKTANTGSDRTVVLSAAE